MKKIIFLLVVLLILGGGGYAGYMYLFAPPPDEAAKEEEAKKPKGDPIFVRVAPIVVPVIGKQKAETFLTLVVTLEVDEPGNAALIQAVTPRLIDAFLTALYGALDDGTVLDGKLVAIPMVKQKLQQASDKVMGPNVVRSVLVQTMSRRAL
ncbi:MAG TPA: hypothetical protein VEB64_12120 [Azospirillaceae bacterium]|nr:hypothetical protein [Azospirillaceae bacterium]